MKAIILAAGYATRLLPLTKDFPKPLLPINGRPMINHIMEKIEEIGITEVFVVTNNKFHLIFEEWAKKYEGKAKNIKVINDNTYSNDDRLGAIGDIEYTVKNCKINDDILVVGGDNLFKFSLLKAFDLFKSKRSSTIVAYDVKNLELAKKYGVIEVNKNKRVLSFVEKPQEPKSTLCAICVYFYPSNKLKMIDAYLAEGNNKDAPGNLPAWLIQKDEVYAENYDEPWYDVGSFESLKQAKEDYGEKDVDIEKLKKGIID